MKYDNENRGCLFKNRDKTDEAHADYRGSVNAGGVEYWLNAWVNESKRGTKYLALRLKPKEDPSNKAKPPDDEIPF